jgi:predicted dinucleotide-binding enzyme
MNITLIGAGNIGRTLGVKWAKAGHTVRLGARDPGSPKLIDTLTALRAVDATATAMPIAAALAQAEVILLAIPGRAVDELLAEHGSALAGKTVIDAANTVGGGPMHHLASFRAHASEARAYRAFNTLGWENFENPVISGVQIDLFYCGPEGEAQRTMETLITDIGLRPVWVGDNDQIDAVDALTGLWFALALRRGRGRRLAFKMLT